MNIAPAPDPERKLVLEEAAKLICGDRQEAYGPPEAHFAAVAQMWSAYLDHDVTASQVPVLLALLKIARLGHQSHYYGYVDAVGYLALAEEVACG